MDTDIKILGDPSGKDSFELGELAHLIENDCGKNVLLNRVDSPSGVKDVTLVVGLTIAGLGFSAIGTVLAAISFWRSQRPNYAISITSNGKTISANNLTRKELQAIAVGNEEQQNPQAIEVLISQDS